MKRTIEKEKYSGPSGHIWFSYNIVFKVGRFEQKLCIRMMECSGEVSYYRGVGSKDMI